MELLKHRFGPFLVCLLVVVAGCTAWRQVGGQAFRFNHQKMLHQSLECSDCHSEATVKGAKVGMPVLETCSECHEDIDKKQPPDRQVKTLFENGKFKAVNVTALSPEVIFSHKSHVVDHKVACTECHKGIKNSTAITKAVRVEMKDCIACHAKIPKTVAMAEPPKAVAVANDAPKTAAMPSACAQSGGLASDCAACHQTIRKDVKPATHVQNWQRFHGQKAKDGDQEGMNQCSLCHTQDSCNTCHKTKVPMNHTIQWCQRGHGVSVSIDRDSCTTCHQSDFCISCHKTTAPRNHSGQWGEPRDKHCVNCHLPLAGERCSVCHQQGTPSHAKAPPIPRATPFNMVGTNCRTCHGVSLRAKMLHADNGDDCNYCHH